MVALAVVIATVEPSRAADTVETWDAGATDVDFYVGFDGLSGAHGASFGDIMLGFGVIDGLSVYVGTTLQGSEALSVGEATLYLGVFGTPVDTAHFDLDVFLNISAGGAGLGEFEIAPAVELNFDVDPDMRSWGAYVRAQLPTHARQTTAPAMDESVARGATFHIATSLGLYYTVGDGHQVLVEYDMDIHPDDPVDQRTVDVGGVAFGYNVTISDALELITQLYVDIPRSGNAPEYGVMAGFIATLPRAHPPR